MAKKWRIWICIVSALVFILWVGIPYWIHSRHPDWQNSGQIGDTFGAVNALFSSLAFALLIFTALMQREELELQREELKLTREEIKKSAEAQTKLVVLNEKLIQVNQEQLAQADRLDAAYKRPVLKIERNGFIPNDNKHYSFLLKVKENKCRINDLKLSGMSTNHLLIYSEHSHYLGVYLDPEQTFPIVIRVPNPGVEPLNGQVDIYFDDKDARAYVQKLKYGMNGKYILDDAVRF
jgi:hypothetical protein